MFDALTQTITPIASWLFFASCKSVVAVALIMVCRRVCAKWLSPGGQFSLWFAAIACLIVPFGPHIDLNFPSAWRNEPLASLPITTNPSSAAALRSSLSVESDASPAEFRAIDTSEAALSQVSSISSAQRWLALIWLSIAFGLLVVIGRNQLRYLRIKAAARAPEARVLAIFQECRQHFAFHRTVRILESSAIQSPTLFGWLAPTLLLPPMLARQLNEDGLRHVFLHELTHVRRHDILVNWLAAFVQIAHWFNPLVWYALRRMRADMELACDAQVIGRLALRERSEYGKTLIKLSDLKPSPTFLPQGVGIVESHSELKARIHMITQFSPKTRWQSSFAAASLLIVASAAMTQPTDPASKEQSPQSIRVAQAPATLPARGAMNTPTNTANPTPSRSSETGAAKVVAENHGMRAEYIQIEYVNANDLVSLIRAGSGIDLLSDRGRVAADPRTNTLLVNDTDERRAAVRQLVKTLDVPLKQIQIDARVALVDSDFSRELFAKANSDSVAIFGPDYDAVAELRKVEEQRRGEIISAPGLITDNRKEAMFRQGIEMPNQSARGSVGGQPTQVELSVRTRPTIRPDNRIRLAVSLTRDMSGKVVATSTGDEKSGKDISRFGTDVLIDDGQTVVMRGLLQPEKSGSANDGKKELLVFLKARIVFEEAGRNL